MIAVTLDGRNWMCALTPAPAGLAVRHAISFPTGRHPDMRHGSQAGAEAPIAHKLGRCHTDRPSIMVYLNSTVSDDLMVVAFEQPPLSAGVFVCANATT